MGNTRRSPPSQTASRAAWCAVACLTATTLFGTALSATEPGVPPDLQAAIFSRVLAYDRGLKSRAGATVTFGVLYVSANADSTRIRENMVRSFGDLEPHVQGLPLRVVSHAFADPKHLADWVQDNEVDVLYVSSGFSTQLGDVRTLANEKKIITLTPVREYVEQGLAIAVVPQGRRPQIVVNLPASRAVGMDIDPRVLQLSEILK